MTCVCGGGGCAHVVASQTDVDFKEVQNAPAAKKGKLVNSDYGCYLLFGGGGGFYREKLPKVTKCHIPSPEAGALKDKYMAFHQHGG